MQPGPSAAAAEALRLVSARILADQDQDADACPLGSLQPPPAAPPAVLAAFGAADGGARPGAAGAVVGGGAEGARDELGNSLLHWAALAGEVSGALRCLGALGTAEALMASGAGGGTDGLWREGVG